MHHSTKKKTVSYGCFRVLRWLIWLFYPKTTIEGLENLPDEPCIIVGNHAKMNGPIVAEIYFPTPRAIWCAGPMMRMKDVPAYAYEDFWRNKPRLVRPFFKLLSYLIAPLAACLFQNANTISVDRDSRVLMTFKQSVRALKDGKNLIIFPEYRTKRNHIVNEFQTNFIDVAKLYYKQTGKAICFVPMYLAPNLRKAVLAQAVQCDPESDSDTERKRICEILMNRITETAQSLPRHIVVPYDNVPRKEYPYNIACEEASKS